METIDINREACFSYRTPNDEQVEVFVGIERDQPVLSVSLPTAMFNLSPTEAVYLAAALTDAAQEIQQNSRQYGVRKHDNPLDGWNVIQQRAILSRRRNRNK